MEWTNTDAEANFIAELVKENFNITEAFAVNFQIALMNRKGNPVFYAPSISADANPEQPLSGWKIDEKGVTIIVNENQSIFNHWDDIGNIEMKSMEGITITDPPQNFRLRKQYFCLIVRDFPTEKGLVDFLPIVFEEFDVTLMSYYRDVSADEMNQVKHKVAVKKHATELFYNTFNETRGKKQ